MMMTKLNRLLFVLLVLPVLALPGEARPEVDAEVTFEAGLAPYGEWVVVPHHGRVWRPRHRHAGWRPYFHGRWVWTSDGWFWDSDEPFGWATYHYGRWYPDPTFGWVWTPGHVWGPAWVSWRFGGGAIGWAPLLPGVSVWWTAGYPAHQSSWVFVPAQRFAGVRVESASYSPSRNGTFFAATRPAPPRAVSGASAPRLGGPPRTFVERQMGRHITPVRVAAASTPQAAHAAQRAGAVSVYRPPHLAGAGPGRQAPMASHRQGAGTALHAAPPSHARAPRPAPHAAAAPRPQGARSASHGEAAPHPGSARSAPHTVAASRPRDARPAPHPAAAPRAQGARSAPRTAMAPHSQGARPGPRSTATPRPSAQGRATPKRQSPTG